MNSEENGFSEVCFFGHEIGLIACYRHHSPKLFYAQSNSVKGFYFTYFKGKEGITSTKHNPHVIG
jgi:hypothetical protein